MARESHRTPLPGSTFVRLLAAMTDAEAPASKDDFAQRLTQWFDWTHAWSLSTALGETGASPAQPSPPARGDTGSAQGAQGALGAEAREHARVKATLLKGIAEASTVQPSAVEAADAAAHRRRYAAFQQTMEARIAPLRRQVRAAMSTRSSALARLATLDTLMEQVVGAQERVLLAGVPALLERRFEQLHQASDGAVPGPWLERCRQDMQALLLAELELRLQPVEGLLEAGRAPSSESHA